MNVAEGLLSRLCVGGGRIPSIGSTPIAGAFYWQVASRRRSYESVKIAVLLHDSDYLWLTAESLVVLTDR